MVQSQPITNLQPVRVAPVELNSLSDARSAYGFQFLVPKAIPAQFSLARIDHFLAPPHTIQWDVIVLNFKSQNQHYLTIRQGVPIAVGGAAYDLIPEGSKGALTVQGQPALWTRGVLLLRNAPQPGTLPGPNDLQWQDGRLALAWKTGPSGPHPGGYLGYRLESDSLTLDQLTAIADSVALY